MRKDLTTEDFSKGWEAKLTIDTLPLSLRPMNFVSRCCGRISMHVQVGIKEAAKTLGISPSTLKRLCDQNIVPNFRTPGGHRRFDRTLIDIARRRLLGQTSSVESSISDQLWCELLSKGSESELRQHLRYLGSEGKLVEQIDLILEDSVSVLNSLSQANVASYRVRISFQAALNTITWKSTRFLSRHRCQSRALGISSGSMVDELGSAIVELALRMSRIDALSIRSCTDVDRLIDCAQRINASHIWLCHLTNHTLESMNQQIEYLLNSMHSECSLLVLAPQQSHSQVLYDGRCQFFSKVSQFLTVQVGGFRSA